MKSKQFNTGYWDDPYIYDLEDQIALMFTFYFTNEKVNMQGLYQIQDRKVVYYRKSMENGRLQEIKQKFEADHKYFFYKDWVYVVNNHKNNTYSVNEFVIASFVREFNTIPFDVRDYFLTTKQLTYIPPFNLKKIIYSINEEKEMVMEIDKEKEKRLVGSLGGSLSKGTDVIDVEQISKEIDEKIKLENKLAEMSTN